MRRGEVLREAWRNTATGVARPGVLAAVFAALVGGLAIADARVLVGANAYLTAWRDAGASVVVLRADNGVHGAACESLAATAGITASGAARERPSRARLLALPQGTPPQWDVTGGFARQVVSTPGSDPRDQGETLAKGGVLLSASLAETLGRQPGSTVATAIGAVRVAAVYDVPDDGRDQQLSYAMLALTTPDGTFDECRAEVWPPDGSRTELVRSTLLPGAGENATVTQLNARLGASLDIERLYRGRPTRHAPVAAALIGLVLGLASVRARRLELASALHAGVPRTAVHLQVQAEAAIWTAAALVLVSPALTVAVLLGNTYPIGSALPPVLAVLAAGALAVPIGTLLGATATREDHLFRYFKNR